MNYTKEVHYFKSSNGINEIAYYIYKPLHTPKAIFQISHGMCEYIERYEHFIDFLTAQDILVCGNDHLGHKNSVSSKDNLGYFAAKDGYTYLPKDLALLTRLMKKKYPVLPIFLFGHSMGSFIARAYIVQYGNLINGAIICGTSGTNPLLGIGTFLITAVKTLCGEHHRSKFLDQVMFGSYNKKFKEIRTAKDWLTRDEAIVDAYLKDEYCTFLFTTSAFKDLSMLLGNASCNAWYTSVPKKLPLFLISGNMDPVGSWGKGIEEVRTKLEAQNLIDFRYKFYSDYRHEILNERGKKIVYQDILEWIMKRIDG